MLFNSCGMVTLIISQPISGYNCFLKISTTPLVWGMNGHPNNQAGDIIEFWWYGHPNNKVSHFSFTQNFL